MSDNQEEKRTIANKTHADKQKKARETVEKLIKKTAVSEEALQELQTIIDHGGIISFGGHHHHHDEDEGELE